MKTNITVVDLSCKHQVTIPSFYQYDYGQIIKPVGINLPAFYEVLFSSNNQPAKKVLGDSNGVMVPDEYLAVCYQIKAYIFLHTGTADGETVYVITIPVTARPAATDEPVTPVEQDIITEAIATLNYAMEQTSADVAEADRIITGGRAEIAQMASDAEEAIDAKVLAAEASIDSKVAAAEDTIDAKVDSAEASIDSKVESAEATIDARSAEVIAAAEAAETSIEAAASRAETAAENAETAISDLVTEAESAIDTKVAAAEAAVDEDVAAAEAAASSAEASAQAAKESAESIDFTVYDLVFVDADGHLYIVTEGEEDDMTIIEAVLDLENMKVTFAPEDLADILADTDKVRVKAITEDDEEKFLYFYPTRSDEGKTFFAVLSPEAFGFITITDETEGEVDIEVRESVPSSRQNVVLRFDGAAKRVWATDVDGVETEFTADNIMQLYDLLLNGSLSENPKNQFSGVYTLITHPDPDAYPEYPDAVWAVVYMSLDAEHTEDVDYVEDTFYLNANGNGRPEHYVYINYYYYKEEGSEPELEFSVECY